MGMGYVEDTVLLDSLPYLRTFSRALSPLPSAAPPTTAQSLHHSLPLAINSRLFQRTGERE